MKIKHFSAENVHGYLYYDIDFRDDLTFLIGLNGSGKTTVLKLISGLLTPKYLNLVQIKFSEMELTLADKDRIFTIVARQKEKKLFITLNNSQPDEFPILSTQKIDEFMNETSFDTSEITDSIKKFEASPYAKKIKDNIKEPIILGLDRRRTEFSEIDNDDMLEYIFRRKFFNQIEKYEGVDKALADIKEKLYKKVRKNAQKIQELNREFQEKVLIEIMKFEDKSVSDLLSDKFDLENELDDLNNRRKKFDEIFQSLKVPDLEETFDNVFDKAKNMLAEISDANDNDMKRFFKLLIDWIRLKNKLNDIDKMYEVGKEFSSDITMLNLPFKRLKDSLNLFFSETKKEVDITGEGDLKIKIKTGASKTNSIFELSSGEKQLVILFSQLALAQDSKIFIVDEPELSLHLTWQEKFVDALQTACPEMQFILATHAPAIVNKNNRISYCVNLSKMNEK